MRLSSLNLSHYKLHYQIEVNETHFLLSRYVETHTPEFFDYPITDKMFTSDSIWSTVESMFCVVRASLVWD